MILLVGPGHDPPLKAVASALRRQGADFLCIEGDARVIKSWSHNFEAVLEISGRPLPLSQVRSAYLRPFGLATGNQEDRTYLETLSAWADRSPALVVNRPTASALNNSKPLQSQTIRRCGLRVPETLLTTDPVAARRFAIENGAVVYKSTSGIRSIVRTLGTERFQHLDAVRNCPTQFQQYIPGCDLRVHIVGNFLHTLQIESDCDDYRYASQLGGFVKATNVELDSETARSLREMAEAMGLVVAGIDLRRTQSGELYCLEVNPSPGFTYFEQLGNVDLAAHIAQLLGGHAG